MRHWSVFIFCIIIFICILAAASDQARAPDRGAQALPKALGPASNTDANALARIRDALKATGVPTSCG